VDESLVRPRGDRHRHRERDAEHLGRGLRLGDATEDPRADHPPVERPGVLAQGPLVARASRDEVEDLLRQAFPRERLEVVDRQFHHRPRVVDEVPMRSGVLSR
jgi:hypothetical protein